MLSNLLRKYMYALLAILLFIVWMLFFDQNSYCERLTVKRRIATLEREKARYLEKIKNDSLSIIELQGESCDLERYAREHLFMKRENEDVFIIVDQ